MALNPPSTSIDILSQLQLVDESSHKIASPKSHHTIMVVNHNNIQTKRTLKLGSFSQRGLALSGPFFVLFHVVILVIILSLPTIMFDEFHHHPLVHSNKISNDDHWIHWVIRSNDDGNSIFVFVNGDTLNTINVYNCFGKLSNDSNVCNGRGPCIGDNNCSCLVLGYFGDECQNFTCYGIQANLTGMVCSGHGTCTDFNKCQCDPQWHGSNCNITECFSILQNETSLVCSGHGSCVQTDICQCTPSLNYTGVQCEIPKCYGIAGNASNVCSSHGTCSSPNNCTCDAGYMGSQCQYVQCFGGNSSVPSSVCNGGKGLCVAPDTCQCTSGYVGVACQVRNFLFSLIWLYR